MNYAKHYRALMDRAEGRMLVGYSERHHVVPRCMDKASKHTVRLTASEHFVAHLLLVKLHPGNHKLVFAAWRMLGDDSSHPDMKRNNKSYAWLRLANVEARKGNKYALGLRHTDALKEAGRVRMLGKAYAKGSKRTPEQREAKRIQMLGNKHGVSKHYAQPEELREKHRLASLGHVVSDESKVLMSKARKAYWAKRKATDALLSPELKAQKEIMRLQRLIEKLQAQEKEGVA